MSLMQLDPSNIIVANVSEILAALQPTYDKLLTHRKVPGGARASRLSQAYHPSVIALHRWTFDDERSEVALRLSGDSRVVNYCEQTSTLLLLDEEVVGVTLVLSKKNHSMAYVYAVIVEPRLRHTWATAYLKYHSFAHLFSAGFDEIACQAFEGNRDTLSHAKKVGAKTVADNYVWSD